MSDKLTAISLREQQLDEQGHDENCAMREGHDCSCGVIPPAARTELPKPGVQPRAGHAFLDPGPLSDNELLTGPAAAALRAYKAAALEVRAAEQAHQRAAAAYRKALEEFTEAVMR